MKSLIWESWTAGAFLDAKFAKRILLFLQRTTIWRSITCTTDFQPPDARLFAGLLLLLCPRVSKSCERPGKEDPAIQRPAKLRITQKKNTHWPRLSSAITSSYSIQSASYGIRPESSWRWADTATTWSKQHPAGYSTKPNILAASCPDISDTSRYTATRRNALARARPAGPAGANRATSAGSGPTTRVNQTAAAYITPIRECPSTETRSFSQWLDEIMQIFCRSFISCMQCIRTHACWLL